jgi:hypothetical protein
MKPSSKLECLCLVFCCVATTCAPARAAMRGGTHMNFVPAMHSQMQRPLTRPMPRPMHGAMLPRRNVFPQPLRQAGRHFRRQRFFDAGFIGPYLSGSYLTAPAIADVAGPEAAVFDNDDAADYRPPCIVPLIIDLRTEHNPRKLPTVTYGQPGYCPPSIVIAAPRRHLD